MIQVYAMRAVGKDFLTAPWNLFLTEDRRKLADRKKNERERQLFLGAEVLLNKSLELTGVDVQLPARYERNEHGKPYLKECENLYVNWSHSGEYVICAIADREVGIDLQYTGKEPGDALIRKLLQPEEKVFFESVEPKDRRRVFYEYWAVKESFLKTIGTGFYTPLDQFYVEMKLLDGLISYPRIIQKINEKQYSCKLLDFADSAYVAAVCIEERSEEDRCILAGKSEDEIEACRIEFIE